MLTAKERRLLSVFRQFLVGPGEMLCLNDSQCATYRKTLREMTEQGYLVNEDFKGAYSLTEEGFAAMKESHS